MKNKINERIEANVTFVSGEKLESSRSLVQFNNTYDGETRTE